MDILTDINLVIPIDTKADRISYAICISTHI